MRNPVLKVHLKIKYTESYFERLDIYNNKYFTNFFCFVLDAPNISSILAQSVIQKKRKTNIKKKFLRI